MRAIGSYAFEVVTSRSFEDAIATVTRLLADEGFGVLTEIDVQATLKHKLDVDTRRYKILGACNPPFAYRALAASPHIGVLMPCNVVVWDEGGQRVVAAMEPEVMASLAGSPEIATLAREVSEKLHRVLGRLG